MGLISRVSSRTYRSLDLIKNGRPTAYPIPSPPNEPRSKRRCHPSPTRYRHRRQIYWCWCRHRWCCRIWSRYWNRVRLPHHRLRPKPKLETAIVFLRHSWFCSLRSYGSLLFDGCFSHPLRFVNYFTNANSNKNNMKLTKNNKNLFTTIQYLTPNCSKNCSFYKK